MLYVRHTRATTDALLLGAVVFAVLGVAVVFAVLGGAVGLAAGEILKRCPLLVMLRATH